MKILRDIFTNPIGIAINVVHWAIAIVAYRTEGDPFERKLCLHCDRFLTDCLFTLNSVPLILIQVIAEPLQFLFGKNDLIDFHLQFMLIFIIIFQWFLVGFLFNLIVDVFKVEKLKIPFE